jgi:DNA-binding transcriptional MerR regulator
MSSGEAARRLEVSVSFLRKLESLGVTQPARRLSGFDRRFYSAEDVEHLRQIIANRRASQSQQLEAA